MVNRDYKLNLRCDTPGCTTTLLEIKVDSASSEPRALAFARNSGWSINYKTNACICIFCLRKGEKI